MPGEDVHKAAPAAIIFTILIAHHFVMSVEVVLCCDESRKKFRKRNEFMRFFC